MGALVQMLAWTVNIRIYTNVPVIQESWKIMRDFANMLFIIALVVMAYGTIFNIKGYDFRSLIAKFLIAALLINFSLVIGGLIIDATQILNNTFLAAMGDISGRLGQGLNVTELLPKAKQITEGGEAISNLTFSAIITLLFGLFMVFTVVVSVAVPLVVAFVRIPILWALLIVSPLAWLLSILPATKETWDKWWHQFLGWNLFLPYYLFFLYFALYFLSNMPKVIEGLGQTFVNDQVTGLGGNFTFSLIFSYVLVAVFLIGGTKVAMSAGQFSGTGIVNVAKWGRDRVANRIGWTAAQRTGKRLMEQAKEREEASIERQAAWMTGKIGAATGGRFGERGLYERTREEQRAKEIAKEKERQKIFANNIGELQRLMSSGSEAQMLAARMRLTELNAISKTEIDKTYKMMGGDRSVAANEYINGVDFTKKTKEERAEFARTLTNAGARKKNTAAIIEKDALTADQLKNLVENQLVTRNERGDIVNLAEIKEALEKGNKKNLLAIAQYKVDNAIDEARNIDEELQKTFKKMNDDQVLEFITDPSFKGMIEKVNERRRLGQPPGNEEKVLNAMNQTLGKNPKKLASLATKTVDNDTRRRLEVMAKLARREQNRPKIETLRRKEQDLVPQINQTRADLDDIEEGIANYRSNPVLQNQPTSGYAAELQDQIAQLEKQRATKENEVKSLADKRDKINERIDSIKKGEPSGTPTS